MKYSSAKTRILCLLPMLVTVTFFVLSCENKIDLIPKSDLLTLPSITVKDFETVFTDSGRLQLVLSSPLLEQYDNKESSYSEFKSGIKVIFHDGKTEPVGSVTAKYAKFTKNNNLWELHDSVVVINENNDKLETELLFWNQQSDQIYTDRYVKITNEDQVIHGYGFESDSRLNNRKLKKVNAIIYLKEEE
ncbi:MAG: LPS export ABC transporter periplasmic protein LptC [Bacteroidota bacterium]